MSSTHVFTLGQGEVQGEGYSECQGRNGARVPKPKSKQARVRRFGRAVPEKCGWIGRRIASPVGVEDCRHVVLRILVGGVAEQKAGLADSAIAHNNNLLPDRGTRRRGLGRYLVDFGYRVLITEWYM